MVTRHDRFTARIYAQAVATALGALSCLSGCASSAIRMYDGETRPPSEIAVVEDWAGVVSALDGRVIPAAGSKSIELLPGTHQFDVEDVAIPDMGRRVVGALPNGLGRFEDYNAIVSHETPWKIRITYFKIAHASSSWSGVLSFGHPLSSEPMSLTAEAGHHYGLVLNGGTLTWELWDDADRGFSVYNKQAREHGPSWHPPTR